MNILINPRIFKAFAISSLCLAFFGKCHAQSELQPNTLELPSLKRSWFYSSIVPFSLFGRNFLAFSASPDSIHSKSVSKPFDDFKSPLWINIWNGGTSNVAQLRVESYNPLNDWPRSVVEGENLYLFFLSKESDIQSETPVMRRTPGGWSWQPLSTVEASVRRRVYFADWEKTKIFNSLGESLLDLSALRSQTPAEKNLVDLGCQKIGQKWVGLVGVSSILLETTKQSLNQGLPYNKLLLICNIS